MGVDAGTPAAFFELLLPALAVGLVGLLSFTLARRLCASGTAAGLAAVIASLGTLCWRYGGALFSHAPSAAIVLAAATLALGGARVGRTRAPSLLFGLLCGLAVAIEYSNAVVVPWLALYLLASGRRDGVRERGSLAALMLGGAAPLLALAAYNHACFGSPWSVGYAHATSVGAGKRRVRGGRVGRVDAGVPRARSRGREGDALRR